VSPQRSNRSTLIEGTLRCLERLPPERVTARAIAEESGANLASIAYHFGSKDALVTLAVIEGLDRWLADISDGLARLDEADPVERYRRAYAVVDASRDRHIGLAKNLLSALAKALHDPQVRAMLAEGFRKTRPTLATTLGLGDDQAGRDAAGLVLAMFDGMLFQTLLDPDLAIEGARLDQAHVRLRGLLPER